MGLLAVLTGKKGEGEESDEDKAPDSEPGGKGDGYVAEIASAAKEGDWEAMAEAIAGYVKRCSMK
jgi:hypothetical protein